MTEQHTITVKRLTGTLADEVWKEHRWRCTCGAEDIIDDRSGSKAWRAGREHLAEAHGQTGELDVQR